MKVGVFSCKSYDRKFLIAGNHNYGFELHFIECGLSAETVLLARPYDAVSVFVDDIVDANVLDALAKLEINHIALRCPGYANIDLEHARKRDITVSRVPSYTPASVAEHTVALILALNRKLYKAYNRVIESNFDLEGLLGFNLKGRTVGVIGVGKIGSALIKILNGFGCEVLCSDPIPSAEIEALGARYVALPELFQQADIISLHCPLTEQTRHIIDHKAIQQMKDNVMIINTSQGGLLNIKAILTGLKSRKIGYFGLDIYDMKSELLPHDQFHETFSLDTCQRLSTFPNVMITGHQGFFTDKSMQLIADTTLRNLQCFFAGKVNQETFL